MLHELVKRTGDLNYIPYNQHTSPHKPNLIKHTRIRLITPPKHINHIQLTINSSVTTQQFTMI